MKLADLTKNISNMSEDELREHVRNIRHTKIVAKPAKAKHVADAVKKTTRQKVSKVDKLVNGMSDADKAALLAMLEADDDQLQLNLGD